jgi:hypothetical protein
VLVVVVCVCRVEVSLCREPQTGRCHTTLSTQQSGTVKTMSAQGLAIVTSQKPWMNSLANTRTKVFANFRLLSGHDCLAKHLYHIGSFPHPYHICDQEQVDRHRLVGCTAVH